MTHAHETTSFDLLLHDLQQSCNLSAWQSQQMCRVFAGFAGWRVGIRSA